jgi:hypothetical protein
MCWYALRGLEFHDAAIEHSDKKIQRGFITLKAVLAIGFQSSTWVDRSGPSGREIPSLKGSFCQPRSEGLGLFLRFTGSVRVLKDEIHNRLAVLRGEGIMSLAFFFNNRDLPTKFPVSPFCDSRLAFERRVEAAAYME